MARFVLCSLQLTTTHLRRIAVSLKAGVEASSNDRRIRRFLAGYDLDYAARSTLPVRLLPPRAALWSRPMCWSWTEPSGTLAPRPSPCS